MSVLIGKQKICFEFACTHFRLSQSDRWVECRTAKDHNYHTLIAQEDSIHESTILFNGCSSSQYPS